MAFEFIRLRHTSKTIKADSLLVWAVILDRSCRYKGYWEKSIFCNRYGAKKASVFLFFVLNSQTICNPTGLTIWRSTTAKICREPPCQSSSPPLYVRRVLVFKLWTQTARFVIENYLNFVLYFRRVRASTKSWVGRKSTLKKSKWEKKNLNGCWTSSTWPHWAPVPR